MKSTTSILYAAQAVAEHLERAGLGVVLSTVELGPASFTLEGESRIGGGRAHAAILSATFTYLDGGAAVSVEMSLRLGSGSATRVGVEDFAIDAAMSALHQLLAASLAMMEVRHG